MSNAKVLGLELNYDEEEMADISPMSALVVFKGLDREGNEANVVVMTPDIGNLDAAGMLRFADTWIDMQMRLQLYQGDEKYGEDDDE